MCNYHAHVGNSSFYEDGFEDLNYGLSLVNIIPKIQAPIVEFNDYRQYFIIDPEM